MAVLGLSACSNDGSTAAPEATAAETPSSAVAEPAANLVGSGCSAYGEQVPEGPGSVGADVTVTGEGNSLEVNDAGLVCGGVSTANAQVYMIDTVLMPPTN